MPTRPFYFNQTASAIPGAVHIGAHDAVEFVVVEADAVAVGVGDARDVAGGVIGVGGGVAGGVQAERLAVREVVEGAGAVGQTLGAVGREHQRLFEQVAVGVPWLPISLTNDSSRFRRLTSGLRVRGAPGSFSILLRTILTLIRGVLYPHNEQTPILSRIAL